MSESGDPLTSTEEPEAEPLNTAAISATWSSVLERAAGRMGLNPSRLAENIVVCSGGKAQVAFWGVVGNQSGRVAHALCRNDGWVRRYLASKGIPTVAGAIVGLGSASHAHDTAERLGFPLVVRPSDQQASPEWVVEDAAGLRDLWQRLRSNSRKVARRQVVIERVAEVTYLAVVIGRRAEVLRQPNGDGAGSDALSGHRDTLPGSATLAMRAVTALPGLRCGMVRLAEVNDGDGGRATVVDGVDPTFGRWWSPGPEDALAERLAEDVLRFEFELISA